MDQRSQNGDCCTESGKRPENTKVAVIGGGLVGSLCACFLAKRGFKVELYEYRCDIRKAELVKGRSINLALSNRGRAALREIGVEDHMIQEHGIPMGGRMIHRLDWSMKTLPYDARTKKCIYSVGRKYLNEVLLTAAEKYSNLSMFFNHKLVNARLESGILTFLRPDTQETVEVHADLIIGADGAFSAVRKQMLKISLFDFSQTYIEHGYLELCIPPGPDGNFQMKPNFLHIWPRGEFMMIALPNQDRSWTVTLFMPFKKFETLDTADQLLTFFERYFPDSIPLIGQDRLVKDFFNSKPSTLVSIKCKPYHVANRALIIGDAAHAMVPFYGQGMNAGFEDCLLLDRLMSQYSDKIDLGKVLEDFSTQRHKNAHAICDLAMYNYVEMRDLVTKRSYLLRKTLDDFLFRMFPQYWVPLYNSVTFSNMGYKECIENRKWQDEMLKKFLWSIVLVVLFAVLVHQFWSSTMILGVVE